MFRNYLDFRPSVVKCLHFFINNLYVSQLNNNNCNLYAINSVSFVAMRFYTMEAGYSIASISNAHVYKISHKEVSIY